MKLYVYYILRTAAVFFLLCLLTFKVQAQNLNTSVELSEDERVALEQRAIGKIYDFLSYLPEIMAKSNKSVEEKKLAKRYIEHTLNLFIGGGKEYQFIDNLGVRRWHDKVIIQNISRGKARTPMPIDKYLERLMTMPCHKVTVDSCNAIVINKIHKTTDDQYWANADVMVISQDLRDGRYVIKKSEHQINININPQIIDINVQEDPIGPTFLGDIHIKSEW